jgi:hypothetical protein
VDLNAKGGRQSQVSADSLLLSIGAGLAHLLWRSRAGDVEAIDDLENQAQVEPKRIGLISLEW